MKFLFIILLFPASLFAADTTPLELKQAVAFDLQLLMDDTVNEGQNIADIIYHGEVPNVRCKTSPMRHRETRRWAFCFVDFHVISENGPEANRTCAVLYHYDPADIFAKLKRGPQKHFLSCMEVLDEIIQ